MNGTLESPASSTVPQASSDSPAQDDDLLPIPTELERLPPHRLAAEPKWRELFWVGSRRSSQSPLYPATADAGTQADVDEPGHWWNSKYRLRGRNGFKIDSASNSAEHDGGHPEVPLELEDVNPAWLIGVSGAPLFVPRPWISPKIKYLNGIPIAPAFAASWPDPLDRLPGLHQLLESDKVPKAQYTNIRAVIRDIEAGRVVAEFYQYGRAVDILNVDWRRTHWVGRTLPPKVSQLLYNNEFPTLD
ncbi:hypothetical protein Dda_6805 [Drechslerella dactyloides]|uniref:Uncharacterized protein n=1 Tax=Drechslerella dactyloides TaxID=74499 RepID=A0AAD6IUT9_DREDA|nr:hypothetical protein Dda_6805 [Drechslerella dactyloides]